MDKSDFILLDIDRDTLMRALSVALSMRYSDNLRDRSDAKRIDNTVRGYAAQNAVKTYLERYGARISSEGKINPDGDVDLTIIGKNRNVTAEVKSSLLPCRAGDDPDMRRLMGMGMDIKMIARMGDIEKDVSRDLYIQTYYSILRTERDRVLVGVDISGCRTKEELYGVMGLDVFLNNCFLVGWTTGHAEREYLRSIPPEERQWTYEKRCFWRCPLSEAYPPRELATYIRNI